MFQKLAISRDIVSSIISAIGEDNAKKLVVHDSFIDAIQNYGDLRVSEAMQGERKTLSDWQKYIHGWAESKGWWNGGEGTTFFAKLVLMHSELSEALEEYRKGIAITEIYHPIGSDKPEGIPVELADVIIRILDFCGHHGIDLESVIAQKMAYNEKRPYRHGNKRA